MRFGLVLGIASMAMVSAALPPTAQAWGPEAPLPPVGVVAVWTEDATRITWLPAAAPLAEVTGYTVYRMDEPGPMASWAPIGTTPADTTEFTDTAIPPGEVAFYYVIAQSTEGNSMPSQPTASGGNSQCPWYEFEPVPLPPAFTLHPECLGALKLHIGGP